MSDVQGSVAIQRGDANTAVDAVVNAPVLPADYVNTGSDSRAEVDFDPGTMVRLGDNVQMRFSKIDPNDREIQLAEGTIEVRLLHGADGATQIDTPSISVVPRESGSYRITVTSDGETRVTVRSGHADIQTSDGGQPLDPGSTLIAQGPANEPNLQQTAEIASDGFDAFNADRDRVYTQVAQAAPYVNPTLPGAEDLPSYGHWETDPSYGNVWVPNDEPANWAPYQDGSWAWEDYYGWTWVAAEPWGWAPYHYGRWYHNPRFGWAWVPVGPGVGVPAWSPALVGFVGFGATIGAVGIGIGFGFGNIGWVPLAPGDPFHPWWGPRANVFSVAAYDGGIGVLYRNARFNYGMTSISTQRWLAGDWAHRTPMTVAALRGEHFGAVRGGLPVVPTAANLRFNNRPVPQQLAYHSTTSFAGHATVAPRGSFEAQRQSLARSFHTEAPAERLGATSSERFAAPARSTENFSARPETGWSHFNTNRGTTYEARPSYARPSGENFSRSAGQSYARPSYARPAQSYSRPSYGGGQNYSRPTQSYSRPSYGGGQNYSRPAQSYSRPAQSYSRPAQSYSRPAQSYSRPSGGGGSRPAPRDNQQRDRNAP